MKKIIVILLLLLPALAYAQPSIKFMSEEHDFGDVKQGPELEHTFEFENNGTRDLVIARLVPA